MSMKLKNILFLLVLSLCLFACAKEETKLSIGSSLKFEDVLEEYSFEGAPFGMNTEILDIDTQAIYYNFKSSDGFEVVKYTRDESKEVVLSSSELMYSAITSFVVKDDTFYYILEEFDDVSNTNQTSFNVYKHSGGEDILLLSVLNETNRIPKLRVLDDTLYGFFNERKLEGPVNHRQDYIYNFNEDKRVFNFPLINEEEFEYGAYWVKENIVGQDYLIIQKENSFYKFKDNKLEFITDLPLEHIIPVSNQMFILEGFSGYPLEIKKLDGSHSLVDTNIYVEHINTLAVFKDYTIALVLIDSQPQVVVLEIYNDSLLMTVLKSYDGYEAGSDQQDGLFVVTNEVDHYADIKVLKVLENKK